MIKQDEIIEIGKFLKPHALKGELNASLDIEEEFLLDGNPLIIERDGIFVPFYVKSLRPKGKTTVLIKIDGVDSQEEASEFVNNPIYADRRIVKEYYEIDEDIVGYNELKGYSVTDESGNLIGEVERIDDATANILLIVKNSEGDRVYLPFAEDLIEEIKPDNRRIVMNIPNGVIDLNVAKE